MENEEKKFKIEKINKYNKELEDEKKETSDKAFLMGASAICVFLALATLSSADINNNFAIPIIKFIGSIQTGYTIYQLKGMLESINKKTILQVKIDDLKDELELMEKEEKKERTRWK